MIVEEQIFRLIPPQPEEIFADASDTYRESKSVPTVEPIEDIAKPFVFLNNEAT